MTFKRTMLIILSIYVFVFASLSQVNTKTKHESKIGITFSSFGDNDVIRFQQIEGSASYMGDKFYTFGINYVRPLNGFLDFETGIEYSNHGITVHANMPPQMDATAYPANLSLINIPVSVRLNFLKYFFINGGFLLDIDISNSSPIDKQTGMGCSAGLGIEYDFNFGISVFINPYLKAHSLIPFSREIYPQRLVESGFRFGIMYKLP